MSNKNSNDYKHTIHLNGVEAFVRSSGNGKLRLSGWTYKHYDWKPGDNALIVQKNGKGSRYKFENIDRPGNPRDQYFADLKFNPRK